MLLCMGVSLLGCVFACVYLLLLLLLLLIVIVVIVVIVVYGAGSVLTERLVRAAAMHQQWHVCSNSGLCCVSASVAWRVVLSRGARSAPSAYRHSGLCGRVCGGLLPSSPSPSNMAKSGEARLGSTCREKRAQNGGWAFCSRGRGVARGVCSGAAIASRSEHSVRIAAACCIRPSITHPGARVAIASKFSKSAP